MVCCPHSPDSALLQHSADHRKTTCAHSFRHLPRKWRIHEKEIQLRDMDVGGLAGGLRRGIDIQQYSLSLESFVPSGGGVCLQEYLKFRQEIVSEEVALCSTSITNSICYS